MKFLSKKYIVLTAFLVLFLGMGMVCAGDNVSDDSGVVDVYAVAEDSPLADTHIESKDINSYYKEKNEITCYLTDSDGKGIENRNVSVSLDGKTYQRLTDSNGAVKVPVNLKPNTYSVAIAFAGDDDFNASSANALVKIKKAPLTIKTSNFKTYVNSDLFFKAKISNSVTKNPVAGIKVLFKVYSLKTKKFTKYYRTTDKNGIATLNKNLRVGSYRVYTYVVDKNNFNVGKSKNRATVTVKPTAEVGCCSYYIQVNDTDSLCGFRRDSTYSVNIYIKNVKWHGRTALKQYKSIGGYSFHVITTSDGWMIGTGGADSASINRAIEKLAGEMVSAGKINNAKLKTIKYYIARLGIGHFAIKTPSGKYAAVWLNGIKTGKLKAGQFMCVPNAKSCFRTGSYAKFDKDPLKAAIKIAATDPYGLNKREISAYYFKKTTKNYKTASSVKAYAANDNGKYSDLPSKAHLIDNFYFKGKLFSKNKIPIALKYKYLGSHSFGNIDKLIKTATTITAPEVHNQFNQTKYFKVTVKNKKTKKAISGTSIKIKLTKGKNVTYYNAKTDSKGVVKMSTKDLAVGNYTVAILPANNVYLISGKSKIEIKP